jgi:hypothetical protein
MVLLTLALMTAGIGGAVAAHAAARPAELSWSPTTSLGSYDYGTLTAGATKSVTFTLTNTGGKPSGPLRITLLGSAAFTIRSNRCTGSLGPNKSCTVPIVYTPMSSGQSESAALTATGKSASASLTLIGKADVGGTPTPNLTLNPGTFTGTTNGTNDYSYTYLPSIHTTTFTVTNSGTSASEKLVIECDGSATGACPYPFTLTHDTCTNTSLAANGGSCTVDLEVTFNQICKDPYYSTELDVVGTGVTYITLDAFATC